MTVQTAVITQQELQAIHDLGFEIEEKQSQYEKKLSSLRDLLFSKASTEPGRFEAHLVFRRMHNPAWKQVVIDKLGIDYAEQVRKATPTVTRCEVKIIEHAIPPLWLDHQSERDAAK